MALDQIDPGTSADDGTGTEARDAATIINNIIALMWDTVTGGIAYPLGNVGIGTTVLNELLTIKTTGTNASFSIERADGSRPNIWKKSISGIVAGDADLITQPIGKEANFIIKSFGGNETFKVDNVNGLINSIAPVYANNAAALVGGLVAGDLYKTASTGDATVMITNAT